MAADEAAGQEIACPKCGATLTVPATSEENLVLVFAKGTPENGAVITLAELARGIADGRYCGIDLIWRDNGWKSLESQYEMPKPPEHASPVSAPEIALHLSELPPAPGVKPSADTNEAIVYQPKWTRWLFLLLLLAVIAGVIGIIVWLFNQGGNA